MAHIKVDGKAYLVLDDLGWQAGHYAKEVKTEDGPRIAVKQDRFSRWRWWTAQDCNQPGGRITGQRAGNLRGDGDGQ